MIKNDVDIDVVLAEQSDVEQSKFNGGKYNKTTIFTLPMISLNYRIRAMSKYLKNAFLDDGGIEHDFDKPIFLLLKVKDYKDRDWIDFCKSVLTVDSIKEAYLMDYFVGREDGCDLIMYVFDVPDKWAADFELFKAGKYSKMSDAFKKNFPKEEYSVSGGRRESQAWGALNKSDTLKDIVVKEFINPGTSSVDDVISLRRDMDTWPEIWDKPHAKEEVFRLKEKGTNADTNTVIGSEILQHRANC